MNLPSPPTVTIIGGAGKMGTKLAELFTTSGSEVIVFDRSTSDSLPLTKHIEQSDLLLFCVPAPRVKEILDNPEIRTTILTKQIMLSDICSVKHDLQEVYDSYLQEGVSICSTHPLCNTQQSFTGHTAVLCHLSGRLSSVSQVMRYLFEQAASMETISLYSLEQHDTLMSLNQLLPHLIARGVVTVHQQFVDTTLADKQLSLATKTLSGKIFDIGVSKIIKQDPKISAEILSGLGQTDNGAKMLSLAVEYLANIRQHIDSPQELKDILSETKNPEQIIHPEASSLTKGISEILGYMNKDKLVISKNLNDHGDQPGLLHDLTGAFDKHQVNIKAIYSLRPDDQTLTFHIGIESSTHEQLAPLTEDLNSLGWKVI